MVLCVCGCGGEIIIKLHHRWKPVKYINGHNPIPSRGKFKRTEEQNKKMSEFCKEKSGRKKGFIPWNWKGGSRLKNARQHNKRRKLGSIPLNNPFENSEGHHIDKQHVIYIPYEWNRVISHNVYTGYNMETVNTYAYFFLMMQNIQTLNSFFSLEKVII